MLSGCLALNIKLNSDKILRQSQHSAAKGRLILNLQLLESVHANV